MQIDTIDIALKAYQVKGESETLISLFNHLINDYVVLVHYGQADLSKKHIREFITYFVSDKMNRTLIKGRKLMGQEAHEVLNEAVIRIKRYFNFEYEDETFNEILIPFLDIAKRYEHDRMDFRFFIMKHFGKYLKQHMITHHNGYDPIHRAKHYNYFVQYDDIQIKQTLFGDEFFTTEDDDDLTELSFISGENLKIFGDLSVRHRRLMYMKYIRHMRDEDIAYELNMHEKSVQRAKRTIVKALWEGIVSREIACMIPN